MQISRIRPGDTSALTPKDRQRYKEAAVVENAKRNGEATNAYIAAVRSVDELISKYVHPSLFEVKWLLQILS